MDESPSWHLHSCKQLSVSYNRWNTEQEYILLCDLQFNKSYYSNYMKKYFNVIRANITMRDVNEVDILEYPSTKSMCLKATLQLSYWTLTHAKYITHVSLKFLKGNIAPTISFLESVTFFQAEFNDDIYYCILFFSIAAKYAITYQI
jgi:hypothetical protein